MMSSSGLPRRAVHAWFGIRRRTTFQYVGAEGLYQNGLLDAIRARLAAVKRFRSRWGRELPILHHGVAHCGEPNGRRKWRQRKKKCNGKNQHLRVPNLYWRQQHQSHRRETSHHSSTHASTPPRLIPPVKTPRAPTHPYLPTYLHLQCISLLHALVLTRHTTLSLLSEIYSGQKSSHKLASGNIHRQPLATPHVLCRRILLPPPQADVLKRAQPTPLAHLLHPQIAHSAFDQTHSGNHGLDRRRRREGPPFPPQVGPGKGSGRRCHPAQPGLGKE